MPSQKSFFLLEIPENNNNKKREKGKIFETIKMKFFNSQNLFFCSKSQKSIIIKKVFSKNLLKTTFFCSKSALANNNKWHEKDYYESRCTACFIIIFSFFWGCKGADLKMKISKKWRFSKTEIFIFAQNPRNHKQRKKKRFFEQRKKVFQRQKSFFRWFPLNS